MVSSIISAIISSIIAIYIAILAPLWFYTVKYGLRPSNAYGTFLNPPAGYLHFYSFLFTNVVISFASIGILLFALVFLYESTVYPSGSYYRLFRAFFSVFLSYLSLKISYIIIYAGFLLYSIVWGINPDGWYSIFSVTGIMSEISGSGYGNIANVMDFLLLTTYFASISSLFFILLLREAAMALIMIILPIFSVLIVFDSGKRIAYRLYMILIEFSLLPFFILVDLYLIHIFSGIFPMQLALLALAPAVPALVFPETIINGFHMKIFDFMGYLSGIGRRSIQPVFQSASSKNNINSIDWDSVMKKDFEYRRDEN
ncbi:MAG: hypothetical protein ACP5UV_04965 [Thermoplasmata archaeon]